MGFCIEQTVCHVLPGVRPRLIWCTSPSVAHQSNPVNRQRLFPNYHRWLSNHQPPSRPHRRLSAPIPKMWPWPAPANPPTGPLISHFLCDMFQRGPTFNAGRRYCAQPPPPPPPSPLGTGGTTSQVITQLPRQKKKQQCAEGPLGFAEGGVPQHIL